jgi:Mor family transcriptional regulator
MMAELLATPQDRMFFALVVSDGMTTVPDMFKVLGRSKFLEFVDLFGGQTVNIPTQTRITQALRDVAIYSSHVNDGESKSEIAQQHGLSAQQVRRIIDSVDEAIKTGAQNANS